MASLERLLQVIPGNAAADLGKAEDAAHASGDTGVLLLTVRQDTPASSTSTDGDYQAAKTDSIGRLWVAPQGENFAGYVGSKQKTVTTNFTRPADTTAYAAGDAVSNSTSAPSVITFDAVARANAGSGIIIGAVMIDSANQTTKGQFELYLYDTTFAADNDNALFTPSDAETETLIGIIQFNNWFVGDATSGAGGNAVCTVQGLSIPYTCGGAVDDVFGLLVVRNAYTPVSAEKFTFRLQVVQN